MGIFDVFKSKTGEMVNKAGDIADKAKDQVSEGFDKVKDQASGMMGGAKEQATDAAGGAQDQASGGMDGLKDQAAGGLDKAKEFADDKTGGRFGDQTAQGVDIAKQRMGTADEEMRAEADQNG